jgi:ABC-type multidrug transport system fused ATPase/permease subunit
VLPRLWLEFLAVLSLCLFISIILIRGTPIELIIPTVGIFAASAFRLMPSVNRIIGSLAGMRFSLSPVCFLIDEFNIFNPLSHIPANHTISFNRELKLASISYSYTPDGKRVLDGINLIIKPGSCIGFIGESGVGKSTLIDLILGLLEPTGGHILVDGVDIQEGIRSWQNMIGYIPQNIFLSDESLRQNIAFGIEDDLIDDHAIQIALRAAQLEKFISDLPDGLDTLVGERGVRLSGGQRQRIGIARALYHNPAVLVLDEATSSLDSATESGVMEAVYTMHGKKTIFIVAHRMSTVKNCDHIYEIKDGLIFDASLKL